MWVEPVVLENEFVRLEPLTEAHREPMRAAAAGNQDAFRYVAALTGDEFDNWFSWTLGLMGKGRDLAFAVRRVSDGAIVGSTRYLNIDGPNKRLEIGFTWYRPDTWASAVNPSCKLLLFAHAFDRLGANRVELKCDARNMRSRAAIAKLGAKQEGIFRKHMIVLEGHIRDTVYFSVIDDEWPSVREGLEKRLAEFRKAA